MFLYTTAHSFDNIRHKTTIYNSRSKKSFKNFQNFYRKSETHVFRNSNNSNQFSDPLRIRITWVQLYLQKTLSFNVERILLGIFRKCLQISKEAEVIYAYDRKTNTTRKIKTNQINKLKNI